MLDEIREKYPQYKVGWLFDANDATKERLDYCISHRFDAIHPNHAYVTPEYVQYTHDHGVLVNVWTPDSEEDIRRMKDCGVDIVISNISYFSKSGYLKPVCPAHRKTGSKDTGFEQIKFAALAALC